MNYKNKKLENELKKNENLILKMKKENITFENVRIHIKLYKPYNEFDFPYKYVDKGRKWINDYKYRLVGINNFKFNSGWYNLTKNIADVYYTLINYL